MVKPQANIPINDDWDFFLHVRYFLDGYFMKNCLVDAALIFQAYVGMLWSKIFGLSFLNLRILTIVFYLIFLLGCYKFLKTYISSDKYVFLSVLLIAFNPLVFTSALTFMTEIYYLTFLIWGIYYLRKSNLNNSWSDFLIFSLFTGVSILIRQFGLITFGAFVIGSLATYYKQRNKRTILKILVFSLVFLSCAYLSFAFPRATGNEPFKEHLIDMFSSSKDFILKTYIPIFSLIYLGFFLLPLSLQKIIRIKEMLLALPMTIIIYNFDIFPIGNVFYIERLYSKSDWIHEVNLFDNIPFKLFLSFLISLSVVNLVRIITEYLKKYRFTNKKNLYNFDFIFYSTLTAGSFFAALAGAGMYDRYFINFFVLSQLIFCIFYFKKTPELNLLKYFLLFILIFSINVFLNMDFFNSEGLKWKVAYETIKTNNLSNEILVDGTFTRYNYVSRRKTPIEPTSPYPLAVGYKCFVQRMSEGNGNFLFRILSRFENSRTLNKIVTNPTVYNEKSSSGFRSIYQNEHKVYMRQEFYSPLYTPLGMKTSIGVFCITIKK